jgi:gamma-glutamyltranspeptidase/glutathione hydrolase
MPQAAEAGASILASGGNAIDAACAAAWALGVCEPGESGLGGQTTMLIRLASGKCVVMDGHSRAPRSLTRAKVGRRAQDRGLRATSIPSTPATLEQAQRRFGVRTLADVLAPAIILAEEGYRITRLQHRILRWSAPYFSNVESGLFLKPNGTRWGVGEVFRQPRLAATLRRLGDEGVRDFYEGGIAREIVKHMQDAGGLISARDLCELGLPVEREPLEIRLGPHRVLSIPPPGGGVQVLLALQLLSRLDASKGDRNDWYEGLALATHGAFRERERWPDHPDDVDASIRRWLVSDARADSVARGLRTHEHVIPVRDSMGEEGNTTHLCASDDLGNVVSLTQSIQSVFGSKRAHPELGFVYNNYLGTCPRDPHPYRLASRCLPQSNAGPTLVLRSGGEGARGVGEVCGRPVLVLGSAGSRRITSSIVQVVSAVLDRGENLADAIAAPRVHALLTGKVWSERAVGEPVRERLRRRFDRVQILPDRNYKLGAVQAIAWDSNGAARGVADPRRDGGVACSGWADEKDV